MFEWFIDITLFSIYAFFLGRRFGFDFVNIDLAIGIFLLGILYFLISGFIFFVAPWHGRSNNGFKSLLLGFACSYGAMLLATIWRFAIQL